MSHIAGFFIIILVTGIAIWFLFKHSFNLTINSKEKKLCKPIVYMCSEYSIDDQNKSLFHKAINSNESISVSAKIIRSNLFSTPAHETVRVFNLVIIVGLLAFLLFIIFAIIWRYTVGEKLSIGTIPEAFWYLTIIFYFFRSASSESSAIENQSEITSGWLIEQGYSNNSDQSLTLLQEQIKIDYDTFKNKTGFGGILLISFSTLAVFMSKLGNGTQNYEVVTSAIIAILFFKWIFESYRSRIMYIALNAIIKIRMQKLAKKNILDTVIKQQVSI